MNFLKNKKPIIVCDIGASPIDQTEFIEKIINNTFSKLIGFEPNKEEFDKLDKSDPKKTFYNFAIGDGEEKILNICRAPGMSSFLEPDMEYLSKFHFFDKHSEIIKKEKVKTKKLTAIKENIDFLKIDVQGYESEIILHGEDKIKNTLVIQIETSPIPLYKNEKSFSKVISQLEELGFNLHMFNNINTRTFKPMIIDNNIYKGLHHLFQLDCVLIKKFENIKELNQDQLIKLILILYYSFGSYDLVDYLIDIFDKKYNTENLSIYRNQNSKLKIQKKY